MKTWTDKTAMRRMWVGDVPPGPWDDEPDKAQWVDPVSDLDCMVHRGPMGAWCGYVGLPSGHPLHGWFYDDAETEAGICVHGGLTFAGPCNENGGAGEGRVGAICHIPEPGRPANVWWLGFDCCHYGDLCPATFNLREFHHRKDVYRDFHYVVVETTALAGQLAGVTGTGKQSS